MSKTKLIIILAAGYLLLQMLADITASKLIALGSIVVPAAVFIYAPTFTWRDLVHKQLGRESARFLIITAAVVNVVMALYFQFTIVLPPAPFWKAQEAYALVLGVVPRIVIASILAEVVSELTDTEIYHLLRDKSDWARVLGSNSISVPLDSLIFVILAFAGTMPWAAIFSIIAGQILTKWVIAAFGAPLVRFVPSKPLWSEE